MKWSRGNVLRARDRRRSRRRRYRTLKLTDRRLIVEHGPVYVQGTPVQTDKLLAGWWETGLDVDG